MSRSDGVEPRKIEFDMSTNYKLRHNIDHRYTRDSKRTLALIGLGMIVSGLIGLTVYYFLGGII